MLGPGIAPEDLKAALIANLFHIIAVTHSGEFFMILSAIATRTPRSMSKNIWNFTQEIIPMAVFSTCFTFEVGNNREREVNQNKCLLKILQMSCSGGFCLRVVSHFSHQCLLLVQVYLCRSVCPSEAVTHPESDIEAVNARHGN